MQKGNMNGKAYRGSEVSFGEFGLKATEPGWITSRQIESARIAITRHVKRGCKVWIRIFPDKPITKKPGGVTPPGFVVWMDGVRGRDAHAP